MQDFYNSLVLAMLGPQANSSDAATALSPQILYTYKALIDNQTSLAKAYRSAETKRSLGELKNLVNIYSTAQKAQTAALGEIASSSRVSSQNIAKLKDGAQKTLERATSKQTSVDEDKRNKIIEAGKANKTFNNSTLEQSILYEATITRFNSTDPVDPDNTKALGTISSILQEVVGAGLSEGDIVAKVREFTAGSPLQEDIVQKIIRYKTAYDDVGISTKKASSMLGSIESYGKELDGVLAGAPGSREKIDAANKRLDLSLKDYGEVLKVSADAARTSQADTAAFYTDYLSASAQYAPALKAISDQIIGRDTSGTARGALVSDPNFKAWAKDNGYNNLGYMSGSTYVEGADDTDAIYIFKYQRMNPDKYRPGIRKDLGDTDDLIVIEKKPSEEYLNSLISFTDSKDGNAKKYLIKLDNEGNRKYLKQNDDLMLLIAKGGYRIDTVGGDTLMLDFRGYDILDETSYLYKALEEEADKPGAKFTMKGLQDAYAKNPTKMDQSLFNAVTQGEDKKLSARAVKALGVVKVDINGNVISPNLDELTDALAEEVIKNPDGTVKDIKKPVLAGEVPPNSLDIYFDNDEKGTKGITTISATTEMPVEKIAARRQRLHAAQNFGEEGATITALTADGEITFDPSSKEDGLRVVDSYSQVPGGRAAILAGTPAKALEKVFEKTGRTEKDELASETKFADRPTEEEVEAEEKESVLKLLRRTPGKVIRDSMRLDAKVDEITGDVDPIFTVVHGAADPLLVGKSRRRQQDQLVEEDAEKRLKDVVQVTGTTPTSKADLPPLQPSPGRTRYPKLNLFADTNVVPAGVQRDLMAALPMGVDAPLPQLMPLDFTGASTQRRSDALPSAISGPKESRLKVPTSRGELTFPYDRAFGSELTPMSERMVGQTPSGLFSPNFVSDNLETLKLFDRVAKRRARMKEIEQPKKTASPDIFTDDADRFENRD